VDWIYLAQDREKWRAAVSMVTNLRSPQNEANFLITSELLASQVKCVNDLVSLFTVLPFLKHAGSLQNTVYQDPLHNKRLHFN
jgi:hypothetical protein